MQANIYRSLFEPSSEPNTEHTGVLSSKTLCLFYYRYMYIKLNDVHIKSLSMATISQSKSKVWHNSRTIRKTAEELTRFRAVMLHIIIILREHMYHSFTGNRFTKHERENEIHAKQQSRISGIMGCSVLFNVTVDW